MCFPPQSHALFQHQLPKVVSDPQFWTSLACEFVWCHNGVHFQNWSASVVLSPSWLPNVLRATATCSCSTTQLPKVLRCWSVFSHLHFDMCFAPQQRPLFEHITLQKCSENGDLYVLTSKCASRHYGVQFLISHLTRWLRTRRLGEPTCQASRATKHWENAVLGHFSTLPRTLIFFLDLLSSDSFSSLTLPTSSASSAHIVDSLTSKLPSINYLYIHAYIYICIIYIYIYTYMCVCTYVARMCK